MSDKSPSTQPANASPEQTVKQHTQKNPLEEMWKPPDSAVARWGFIVALIVAFIYFLQWRAMDQTLKIDQRAWVSLGQIANMGDFAVGKPFSVSVTFKNIGKTPAKNARSKVTIEPRFQDQEPRFERDTQDMGKIGAMLPNADYYGTPTLTTCRLESPAGERGPAFPCPLTQPEYETVTHGTQIVYLHGLVVYDDVFQHPHWFKFCYHMGEKAVWIIGCGDHEGQQVDQDNE